MKKQRFKLGLFLCFAGMLIYLFAGQKVSAKTVESNSCGKSAVWTFDAEGKVLNITGTGTVEMDDDWYELGVEKIVIGKGITEIAGYTFCNLENVAEITLPSTLKKIGPCALSGFSKLTKLSLPKSLTEIGEQAFMNCSKLTTVKIPDSVTVIGYGLFQNCKALKSVTLPAGMNTIPQMMFYRCKKLTKFTVDENITRIEDSAFSYSGIKELTMPETVKELNGYIFYGCKSLESVTWNAGRIPEGTFSNCSSLTEIKMGKNVTSIGNSAFRNTGFTTFKIPKSVTSLEPSVFDDCQQLTKLTITGNVETVPSYVASDCINLQKIVLEEGIKNIGNYAFSRTYAKTIKLPSTVTTIGERAFRRCFGLTSITIPDSVEKIEDYTFSYCELLAKVKIGKKVKEIGECGFYHCTLLDEVTIPASVQKIGYKAFKLTGIKSLTIQDGVKEIDYWAFQNCPNLKDIKIGKDVKTIRFNAFIQCDQLATIEVDKNNKSYTSYEGVLYSKDMKKLIFCPTAKSGKFTFPAKVCDIYGSSFSNCTKITEFAVDYRNPYFSVQDGILYNKNKSVLVSCPSGKTGTIKVPSSVKEIQDYAFHYSQATNIVLPSGLKTIGYCSFEYCPNLEKITIPGSVKTFESAAFWRCPALKEVEIGNGVTKIPDDAFYECTSLKKIKVPVTVTTISSTAFQNCWYELTFYTKKSSYAMKYATKNYFKYKII